MSFKFTAAILIIRLNIRVEKRVPNWPTVSGTHFYMKRGFQ